MTVHILQTDESDTGSWIGINTIIRGHSNFCLFVCFLYFWKCFYAVVVQVEESHHFLRRSCSVGKQTSLREKKKENDLWLSSPSHSALLVGRSAKKKIHQHDERFVQQLHEVYQRNPSSPIKKRLAIHSGPCTWVLTSGCTLTCVSLAVFFPRQIWINNPPCASFCEYAVLVHLQWEIEWRSYSSK